MLQINSSTVIFREDAREQFYLDRVTATRVQPTLAEDIAAGLSANHRCIPCKYFYDAHGSQLFEQICATPEYYPARLESALLARHATSIIRRTQPDHIVELGSGASRKTRHLLNGCEATGNTVQYWPFDVCEAMLKSASHELCEEYPWLQINALHGDYLSGLENLPDADGGRLFVFLGGTLGNFEPPQALNFLRKLRALMRSNDSLLLGVDRVKDPRVLTAAYDDAAGITADFNLNALRVLNRELPADFDLDAFRHRAVYNEDAERIEMYLVSQKNQHVSIPVLGADYQFEQGETILTEVSQKYSKSRLKQLVAASGFADRAHYTPENEYYSLLLLAPQGTTPTP